MTTSLLVETAGPMTTVQDLGRYGAQALGVPVSGALDPLSLRLANALTGNPETVAGLELRLVGPRMRVTGGRVRVALVGAEAGIEVLEPDPIYVPPRQSVLLADGQVFCVGGIAESSCCYLAIAGGLALPAPFGSQSTYVPSAIGGFEGRALRDGDRITLAGGDPGPGPEKHLPQETVDRPGAPIRLVPGPQDDHFTEQAWATLLNSEYTISRVSNRMGLRLEGPALQHRDGYNIPSDGIVTGAIQVPGNGLPIVLLPDRQTTGGYPKIGTVISADLPALARRLPGQKVRFAKVDIENAETLRREKEALHQRLVASIEDAPGSLEERLSNNNLISGVIRG